MHFRELKGVLGGKREEGKKGKRANEPGIMDARYYRRAVDLREVDRNYFNG
jgi:hypothetical protein